MHYSGINDCDSGNGPGWRVSLYVSGCKFQCYNCFNSETWDFKNGQLYTKQTEDFILSKLNSSHISGLSLLGGDPLYQSGYDIQNYLIPLVKKAKQLNKSIWIWSGFIWEEIFNTKEILPKEWEKSKINFLMKQQLIKLCDVWVDGRYKDSLKDIRLPYCGSTNQRVIDVQKTLNNLTGEVILYES